MRENEIFFITQSIFFIIHFGKVLTPKSILFPLNIECFCINKYLITIVQRVGHRVWYIKLLEISKETVYSKIEKPMNYFVCLKNVKKKVSNHSGWWYWSTWADITTTRFEYYRFYFQSPESDETEKINPHIFSKSTNNLKVLLC